MEYINSFNSGQLSPLVTSRSDLPVYQSGCTTLRNFFVQTAGGADRRNGTEYITDAIYSDSTLIPFIFSTDDSFMMEMSNTSIRIFDSTGTIVDTLVSPYDTSDLIDIKYKQIGEILWLVCPNKKPYKLERLTLSPATFEIAEVEFDYPPLLEENADKNIKVFPQPDYFYSTSDYVTGDQVQVSGSFWSSLGDIASGSDFVSGDWVEITQADIDCSVGNTIILHSDSDIFNAGIDDGHFRLGHQRASEIIADEGSSKDNAIYSEEIYLGSNTATINISLVKGGLSPNPYAYIQTKSGAGGTWSTVYSYIGNTSVTQNVIGSGSTYVRIFMETDYGGRGAKSYGSYSIVLPSTKSINFTATADGYSDALNVSFSDWSVKTGGTWKGILELQKSTDGGGSWYTVTTILDTSVIDATNGVASSNSKEGTNTLLRFKYEYTSGTITATINNETTIAESIYRIQDYIDANNIRVTVTDAPPASYGTSTWSEGAFSTYRGYPTAIELFDERIVFSGTVEEPNTLYMSYTGDYYNFLTGIRASDSIKAKPNTNEPTNWLLSTGSSLYQGTRGSVVNVKSTDGSAITPSNITASESLEFGGSTIQALKTNETVVFLQRLNKKLREVFYDDNLKTLTSRDLTILSDDIAGVAGFTDIVLQRTPDQIIYGLRSDGLVSTLTYERSQDVIGWSLMNFGDDVKAISIRPTATYDEVWMVVERNGGSYIERLGSRIFSDDLLDSWFVDSGVKIELESGTKQIEAATIVDYTDFHLQIDSTSHGLSANDKIRITSDNDEFNDNIYTISDVTVSSFQLKSEDGTTYVSVDEIDRYSDAPYLYVSDAGNSDANGTYELTSGTGMSRVYTNTSNTDYTLKYDADLDPVFFNRGWAIYNVDVLVYAVYTTDLIEEYIPAVWDKTYLPYGTSPAPLVLAYDGLSGSFVNVDNTWSGLDHLDGETVQVQGDGGYEGDFVVSGGQIETSGYFNQVVAGLRYLSILQPMYFESSSFASNRYNKTVLDASIMFNRTIGGYSGVIVQNDDRNPVFDFDELETDFPDLDKMKYDMEPINFRRYSDEIGDAITPFSGNKLINYNDSYSRVATQFVICDTPSPMTVQAIAINLKVGG